PRVLRERVVVARTRRNQIALGCHMQADGLRHLQPEGFTEKRGAPVLVLIVDTLECRRAGQPSEEVTDVVQPCGELQLWMRTCGVCKRPALRRVRKLGNAFAFVLHPAALAIKIQNPLAPVDGRFHLVPPDPPSDELVFRMIAAAQAGPASVTEM